MHALRHKYAPDLTSGGQGGVVVHDGKPVQISGKVVEEVGFEKIRQQQAVLQDLRVVVLDGACVAGLRVDPDGGSSLEPGGEEWTERIEEIKRICPMIRELDLSRNLIERWVDVVGICSALPELRRLVLRFVSLRVFIEGRRLALKAP